MTLAEAILAVIWVGISAYAVFGGADFGAGIWDLLAGDAERGRGPRALIERSLGPVWEANHVWLIFVLVYLWTAFPEAFVSIATTLWIPLTLAAFGIIFRGSGFAFRKFAETTPTRRWFGSWFAAASVVTPFFLGTVVGGVASGRVPLGNAAGDPFSSWLNPTSLLGGTMAVLATAHLAAVLLAHDARSEGGQALTEYFRVRAIVSGAAAGVVALIGIWVLRTDAPSLSEGLLETRSVVLVGVSALAGIGSLVSLRSNRLSAARPMAAIAMVAVLWGWGAGQYPWMLVDRITIADAAASDPVMIALLVAFGAAAALAVPALLWLFRLTEGGMLSERGERPDSTTALLERARADRVMSQSNELDG